MSPAMLKEIVKRAVVMAVERSRAEGEVVVAESELLLASYQVQALREPLVPGTLGFRPNLADGQDNHEERVAGCS
jgi:hypothetical protein